MYDLWKILHGEDNEHVYVENLRVMAQVTTKVIDPKRVLNSQANANEDIIGRQSSGGQGDDS